MMNEAIRDYATFIEGKRKYLLLIDQKGFPLVQSILEHLIKQNILFELVFIGNTPQSEQIQLINDWLCHQKMGCYLYLATSRDQIKQLKTLIEEIGFSEEEVQYIGYGIKIMNIFCSRCHGITKTSNHNLNDEIVCKHCHLMLSLSDHYSTLHDAYLGYVARI